MYFYENRQQKGKPGKIKWGKMTIRIGNGFYQPKVQRMRYKSAVIRKEIMALLLSTCFPLFYVFFTIQFIKICRDTSIKIWSISFFVKLSSVLPEYRGRSPPCQSDFSANKLDWRNEDGGKASKKKKGQI